MTPQGSLFRIWLPWSLVVVLAAFVAWQLLGSPERLKTQSPKLTTEKGEISSESTGLKDWPEGKSAVELLGYENVHAFKWSGGILNGWVEFDDGPKPRRVALDVNEQLANEWKLHPKAFSGEIVIARQKAAAPMASQECWVWVRVLREVTIKVKNRANDPSKEQKWMENRMVAYHGPWQARGSADGSSGPDGTRFSLHSMEPGDSFKDSSKWLEVHVKDE